MNGGARTGATQAARYRQTSVKEFLGVSCHASAAACRAPCAASRPPVCCVFLTVDEYRDFRVGEDFDRLAAEEQGVQATATV